MSQEEAIQHWRNGAEEALHSAHLLFEGKEYKLALFLCHLSVEKALKGAWICKRDKELPPRTHDLIKLAMALNENWKDEQLIQFETLTRFVIDARYTGSRWIEEYGTKEGSQTWIKNAETLVSFLLP